MYRVLCVCTYLSGFCLAVWLPGCIYPRAPPFTARVQACPSHTTTPSTNTLTLTHDPQNLLFELIPGGSEAEMMGFFQFCSMILSWLPPLSFIVLGNALGGDLRWALMVVPILHTLGAVILFFACDVEQGKKDIANTLSLRHYGDEAESGGMSKMDDVELTNVMTSSKHPEESANAITSTDDRTASVSSF